MSGPELPKHYAPAEVESRWRQSWHEHEYFHADASAAKVPYAVTLPPPNVTGSLHMGHALGGTIQDILVRWRRMQGTNAMWMPGTDHAGIATQMLVERDLAKREGKSRHDLGRDGFLERVWEWKHKHGGRIVEQMRTMGFSLDWQRERFTMDPGASAAVRETFVALYEQGLIYRAHRLVNWCSDCYTALSDLEVNNVEDSGHLWELRYPIVGDSDRHIVVATTRPETMLGDTGVAVHPDDERYKDLIGRRVSLPLTGREIPIVADSFVDPEFGSGAVKVTPGHDFNDFDCGQRCGLDVLSIINFEGKLTAPAPEKYIGLTVDEARKQVVADLDAQGLLAGTQDYKVPRGRCDRSGTVVEPLLSDQWWVKTQPLAEPAIQAVERGKTKFVPELWTKTYMHWMTNIKDWTISRQLWWGHRIPAWFCSDCEAVMVLRDDPSACTQCKSSNIRQDEDVLDTWFSSALWPFSTLGWPEQNRDLKAFYPNAVLVTAPDIIFFWVARMMMMGLHFMGKVPFRTVYLTPIVTDENGDKMSKVKGNVIDPLDVVNGATFEELMAGAESNQAAQKYIEKNLAKGIPACGSDALRFSLAAMTTPGRNVRLSMERVEGYRHFINKLWNASRFTMMNLDDFDAERFCDMLVRDEVRGELSLSDRWILARLGQASVAVDQALDEYRFSEAANTIYHFVWHELCDWYIELAKPSLYAGAEEGADDEVLRKRFLTQGVLSHVLEQSLRLLHPFCPFVTEEIWHTLPRPSSLPASLMVTMYPTQDLYPDAQADADMALLQEVTVAIRTSRSTYSVPPSKVVAVEVRTSDSEVRELLEREREVVEKAARVTMVVTESGGVVAQAARQVVRSNIEVVVPLAGLVDVDAEKERLRKEISKTDGELVKIHKKLNNQKFVANAPAEVVEKERARLTDEETRRLKLTLALEALG